VQSSLILVSWHVRCSLLRREASASPSGLSRISGIRHAVRLPWAFMSEVKLPLAESLSVHAAHRGEHSNPRP
jgi:hypothetical protein